MGKSMFLHSRNLQHTGCTLGAVRDFGAKTFHIAIPLLFIVSTPCLNLADDAEQSVDPTYIHPKPERFTDFSITSPLPPAFVNAYPVRKQMGTQYLDFFGVIAIVGETKKQKADMRRISHVLMGLIDNDQDGDPDDTQLWKKWKKTTNDTNRLVLYVTETKEKYKSFDGANPNVYHQGWSSFREGEKLHLSNIQEELIHFLQRHFWEVQYPKAFGLDAHPLSIAHAAAEKAVANKHYVYDHDCVSQTGCLVPEFFFCVMTDVMKGWHGDGFDAPGQREWRLKGDRDALEHNYPVLMRMIRTKQQQGRLPTNWPSFF